MIPLFYSAIPIDRAGHLRRDAQAMTGLLADPRRIVIPYWRELSLVAPPKGLSFTGVQAAMLLDLADEVAFLGLAADGAPVLAADISGVAPEADGAGPGLGLGGQWLALRTIVPAMDHGDSGLLAYARGLLGWLRRSRFCGSCGGPTEAREAGHVRACLDPHCGAQQYPRTDPAVIMLVEDGERVLLHRQHAWPAGMWSILAGFVEPGETLEEAVAREVFEETAITVADVRYAGSQPWPFPSSLMVGFTARATGIDLVPCPEELEDARWFSRAEIDRDFSDAHRHDGSGPFLANPGTIARQMLEAWRRGE
ncbi:MAG TPA: NAD(+) diphosphatase [Candidatus Omnitrophota bacterium]|nr:NAD(+) diphosphatase [Candidatus Omnitrophota bacterium]